MFDWTDDRDRSATSRHVNGRDRSCRVRVLVPDDDDDDEEDEVFSSFRDSRITESGFSLFLNGSVFVSPLASVRRRFLLSAMDGCVCLSEECITILPLSVFLFEIYIYICFNMF